MTTALSTFRLPGLGALLTRLVPLAPPVRVTLTHDAEADRAAMDRRMLCDGALAQAELELLMLMPGESRHFRGPDRLQPFSA
jgi:hypothetical protein